MSRPSRLLLRVGLVVVALPVVLLIGLVGLLAGSLPKDSGSLRLAGLKAPVTVTRDAHGIPHIQAASDSDAYFALGAVHAQDRLWQMEMQRRIGAGRLAELLGPGALPIDRFMRTMSLYRLAQQDFTAQDQATQAAITAYVAGINAVIAKDGWLLPPEFMALRARPEPWQPADVLVWARVLAIQLSTNWRDELLRAKLDQLVPPAVASDIWPDPAASTITLASADWSHMLASIPQPVDHGGASNEWVVSGARSASGKPLLANDPHLDFAVPILWYLAAIDSPGLHLAGATIPGLPAVVLGHNAHIAWGMTVTTSDTEDLFQEKLDGNSYATPDGPKPIDQHVETIKVKGAPDDHWKVRATRHGPLVSDLLGGLPPTQGLALSATFTVPHNQTAQAFLALNRAQNWDQFTAAMRTFQTPQVNLSYADDQGHIGFMAPGLVPIRRAGDGTLPVPGDSGAYDWTGWVPFEGLPHALDPPSGQFVNANNRLEPDSYPYLLSKVWPDDYRARRIDQMLGDRKGLTASDMQKMQMDEVSTMAQELKPLLVKAPEPDGPAGAARELVAAWDGDAKADQPEPLIFELWAAILQTDLLQARLGKNADQVGGLRPSLLEAALAGKDGWCPAAGCDAAVAKALSETLAELTSRFGADSGKWRWGDAHRAAFDALLFGHIPVLDKATGLVAGMGGDGFTVQRGAFGLPTMADLYLHREGAGFRAVYDLAAIDQSGFVIATGQSGHPLSRHWSDLLALWQRGALIRIDPKDDAGGRLALLPVD